MAVININISNGGSEAGITAHIGGGQANAYQLTKKFNRVDNCASDGDSVKSYAAIVDTEILIQNNSLNAVDIFPFLGDKFLGQVTDTSFYLTGGQQIRMYCFEINIWTII